MAPVAGFESTVPAVLLDIAVTTKVLLLIPITSPTLSSVPNNVSVPVIASGGCGSPEHMIEIFKESDVSAALAASIFHYEDHSVDRVKQILKNSDIQVRY